MKTPSTSSASRLFHPPCAAALAGLALMVLAPIARAQAVVDPDPEIFDGTKTKRDAGKQAQQAQTTVDDWEGDMVVYDTNGQAPQGEGQGENGEGSGPGNGSGPAGQAGGMPMGLPIPLGGGAGGSEAAPSMQIPVGQQAAEQTAQQGAGSGAQKNADISGAAQSAARPSDVSIGDPSQRIKTTAQGQAGNTPGKPEAGEQGAKEAGEDSTQVPSAASMPQTGNRGGGVEKGDTMPPDQI